jgi:hypothetical protein
MTVLNAEDVYAAGGPTALRLACRGAIRLLTQQGRAAEILMEVAVPIVDLANRLRAIGQKAEANGILEHAVHDGIQASVLAEAIEHSTTTTIRADATPAQLSVGPHGGLMAGPPPAATDLGSTMALANYVRDRLLSFEG